MLPYFLPISWPGEVGKLLEALVLHGYRTEAGQLQALLGDAIKTMEKCIQEIWQPEVNNLTGAGPQVEYSSEFTELHGGKKIRAYFLFDLF